jgi:hypothetical protein
LQKILGEDYQKYYEFHNGNMQLIAEEALGHILKDNLLKYQIKADTPNKDLI